MLHDDFRQARLAAGLSQEALAQRAGVRRKQVQALEAGTNVTVETIRRIASVLPNLRRVTLGGLEVVTANADLDEARRAALDLFDVTKRLVAALGANPSERDGSTEPTPSPEGTARERATAQRLEAGIRKRATKKRRNET